MIARTRNKNDVRSDFNTRYIGRGYRGVYNGLSKKHKYMLDKKGKDSRDEITTILEACDQLEPMRLGRRYCPIGTYTAHDYKRYYGQDSGSHRLVSPINHASRKQKRLYKKSKVDLFHATKFIPCENWSPDYHTPITNDISCVTHEYYLIDIKKHYPFSLTINELLTIDRREVDPLIHKINSQLKYKLKKISLVDYVMYKNSYLCLTFPRPVLETMNKNNETVYAVELVANAKYPRNNREMSTLTKISDIIYSSVVKLGLETNGRLIEENLDPDPTGFKINKIYMEGKEFSHNSIEVDRKLYVLLKESYYPYLDINLLVTEYEKSDDKLLILHGETGGGKTKLSNILIHNFCLKNYKCYSIPGTLVDEQALYSYIDQLVEKRDSNTAGIVFIIDDVDPDIMNRKRMEKENKFFNNLLILLDGNLDLKIKVIITTNQCIMKEFDEPLYRSGRLFDAIHIRYLLANETMDIFKSAGLSNEHIEAFFKKHNDADQEYKQCDITQYIKEIKNNITRGYLKEQDLSHIPGKDELKDPTKYIL